MVKIFFRSLLGLFFFVGLFASEGKKMIALEKKDVETTKKTSNDPDLHYVNQQLKGVDIEEKVGTILAKDVFFSDQNGKKVRLADYFSDEKPLLLSFAYFSCPSLCHFVANAKHAVMQKMGLKLGRDFRALTISFDEKDTVADAKKFYDKYAKGNEDDFDWHFLVGEKQEIHRVTSQLGFNFKWFPDKKEFAHAAAVYVISPNAKISRYFYGLHFSPFDVKMALLEAKEEKYRSSLEKILLYCYRYDSKARGYVADAWLLMRVGGIFTVLAIVFFLWIMVVYEKKRLVKIKEDKN